MVYIPFWTTGVREIRDFLDEDYTYPIKGRGYSSLSYNCTLPWARIGIEKFIDRIIPNVINSNPDIEKNIVHIKNAIKNAVSFGHGVLVVGSNGNVRTAQPENSRSWVDAFGKVSFEEYFTLNKTEMYDGDTYKVVGIDGDVYVEKIEQGNPVLYSTGAKYFTIFYNADAAAPSGRSRLTPSIRASIRAASRNKIRLEEIAQSHAIPKRLFNGIWEGIDPSVVNGIGQITSGALDALGVPSNPTTGEKISVEEFSAADIEPFLKIQTQLANEVASAFNIDPSEFGASTPQNISSEALYASKEDLILEISSFEQEIIGVLQNAIDYLCEVTGNEKGTLTFLEPAMLSKASQADAFVKLASVIPGLQNSRKALTWAGLPSDVVEEIIANPDIEAGE